MAGIYLNLPPSPALVKRHPNRFEFHVLDYDDVLNALARIYELIAGTGDRTPHFLVTVSPVALQSTFRAQDVLVANAYSKSVQRAVIDKFVAQYDADYFPSFEMVTLADNAMAWTKADFRHVNQAAVQRIMAQVLKSYSGASQGQQKLEALGKADAYNMNAMYDDEWAALAGYTDDFGCDDIAVLDQLADAYYAAGEYDKMIETLDGLLTRQDDDPTFFTKDKIDNITARIKRAKKIAALAVGPGVSRHVVARQTIEKLSKKMPANADVKWLRQHLLRTQTHRALAHEFMAAGGGSQPVYHHRDIGNG